MKTYKNNNRILSVECEDGVYTLHIGKDCILETMNTYTLEEYIDNFLAPIKQSLIKYIQTMETTNVVLYQNGKAKIQAETVNELVTALYKGLRMQKKLGKRFLKLGQGVEISIPLKGKKYLHLQKLTANNFEEKTMLEIVEFLND